MKVIPCKAVALSINFLASMYTSSMTDVVCLLADVLFESQCIFISDKAMGINNLDLISNLLLQW